MTQLMYKHLSLTLKESLCEEDMLKFMHLLKSYNLIEEVTAYHENDEKACDWISTFDKFLNHIQPKGETQ